MLELTDAHHHRVHYESFEKYPGTFVSFEIKDHWIDIFADNNSILRIYILTNQIIRFRYAVNSFFPPDFSYAIDPSFTPEYPTFRFLEKKDFLIIKTTKIKIVIHKKHLLVNVYDLKNNLLSADEKGFHWENDLKNGGEVVKMSKYTFQDESFFGLGDKTSLQNIKGKRFTMWGTDQFGYKADTDPLYKNINLTYSTRKNKTFAIFFDNTFRTYYDLGYERNNIYSFWSEGGEMNYYFLYGEDLLNVSAQYALLTGKAEMPPMWALGYQQCKWSYYPEQKVKEITSKLREVKIPCDSIYLDIDYMEGFRCFTWDKEKFPNPKKMISELKENGFKTVAIIDPGIKIDSDYQIFKEGIENEYFCKRTDGPYAQGRVWPGECYFPDFTNPQVREWWAGLFQDLIENIGLAGIWNDMNEPAIFDVPSKTLPMDVRHDYDGHPCSHRKAHNIYGMQMTRATAEGVKRFGGNKRPLLITRSGSAGMQRFTSVWTGDNLASWEHLFIAHMQTLRLSISGVSFCGSDVGGFIDQPDGELFVRWMQLAIFHPFFRNHSSGDHGDQEPWSFGDEYLALVRKAIETRYALLPYMYTCFYDHCITGKPILRPLAFSNIENESNIINNNQEAFLGDHLIFSPVFKKGTLSKSVFLPKGFWYDYMDNKLYSGNAIYEIDAKLDKIPVFARAGSVIPNFHVMQYVGEKKINEVILKIFVGKGKTRSQFYHDDLDGNQYKEGQYRHTIFETERKANCFFIQQSFNLDYEPSYIKYLIQIIGVPNRNLTIEIDGQLIPKYASIEKNIIEISAQRDFKMIGIQF